MVRTRRRPPPPHELLANQRRWTTRFTRIRDGSHSGLWATAKAKKCLSNALRGLAHGKCVYCEGALGAQADLEVDHYVAKTVDPANCFEWENLFPSCRLCNRPKQNHDHAGVLLKPDVEDPELFFWIHPDTGHLQPHPSLSPAEEHRALETIRICDLQRPELCRLRLDMLDQVVNWLERISRGPTLSEIDQKEWDRLSNPAQLYKFVLRHTLELHGQHDLAAHDRRRFHGGE